MRKKWIKQIRLEIPKVVSCPDQTYGQINKQTKYFKFCFLLSPMQTEISGYEAPVLCNPALAVWPFIPPDKLSFLSEAPIVEAAVYSVVTIIRCSLFSFITRSLVISIEAWLEMIFEDSVFCAEFELFTGTSSFLALATALCLLHHSQL